MSFNWLDAVFEARALGIGAGYPFPKFLIV